MAAYNYCGRSNIDFLNRSEYHRDRIISSLSFREARFNDLLKKKVAFLDSDAFKRMGRDKRAEVRASALSYDLRMWF